MVSVKMGQNQHIDPVSPYEFMFQALNFSVEGGWRIGRTAVINPGEIRPLIVATENHSNRKETLSNWSVVDAKMIMVGSGDHEWLISPRAMANVSVNRFDDECLERSKHSRTDYN
jgi:hypothetical protein